MSKILKLYLRPSAKTPVREVERAEALAGQGLVGDHSHGGSRQLTLLDAEAWRRACDEVGRTVDPGGRRANVLVEGLPLAETIGRRLRVGPCEIEVIGETTPCRMLDDLVEGLQAALQPERRAGVYGRIVTGGTIALGDPVEVVDTPES